MTNDIGMYNQLWDQTENLIGEGYEPLAIAATMVIHALSMYRTILSEEEYFDMVDTIYANKDGIQKFDKTKLH